MPRKTHIRLAKNLRFGPEVVTEVLALIAKRGSGKTYAATKLAEEMLRAGAQTIVLDPVGNWYGLRLGQDGKATGGMDIKILGGRHADIPLTHTAGALAAQTVVETGMSAIFDLSLLNKPKQRRFVTQFAEALLEHRKRHPAAMHIFWEEAYRWLPQKMAKGSKNEMLEATEELVTMGRNFGIGGTIIAQRSAQVSKTALTQAGILLAMNTTGPADRKVIEGWVEYHGVEKQDLKLSQLQRGEAYVWWPDDFGLKRIQVAPKQTYDASSTPVFGQAVRKQTLRPIDLGALEAAMAATVEKAQSEDPRLLQRRVRELERELALAQAQPTTIVEQVPVVDKELLNTFDEALADFEAGLDASQTHLTALRAVLKQAYTAAAPVQPPRRATPSAPAPLVEALPSDLKAGEQRLLQALAQVNPLGQTKVQAARLAGLSPRGGTFNKYWLRLVRGGLIYSVGDLFYLSADGLVEVGEAAAELPKSPEELLELWCTKVKPSAAEILRVLFRTNTPLSREEIAESIGMAAGGGSFNGHLQNLLKNGLIQRDAHKLYTVTDALT